VLLRRLTGNRALRQHGAGTVQPEGGPAVGLSPA
jgi:hypothetical protein